MAAFHRKTRGIGILRRCLLNPAGVISEGLSRYRAHRAQRHSHYTSSFEVDLTKNAAESAVI